jgi:hypothetical protein
MPELKAVVINTTPLIALTAATGSLDVIRSLFKPHFRKACLLFVSMKWWAGESRAFPASSLQAQSAFFLKQGRWGTKFRFRKH